MRLQKSIVTKAAKLGVAIETFEDTGKDYLTITGYDSGESWDEYILKYEIKQTGLFYVGSCFTLPDSDHPHWIKTSKDLAKLLPEFKNLVDHYS